MKPKLLSLTLRQAQGENNRILSLSKGAARMKLLPVTLKKVLFSI
jgi:hypothetical protein